MAQMRMHTNLQIDEYSRKEIYYGLRKIQTDMYNTKCMNLCGPGPEGTTHNVCPFKGPGPAPMCRCFNHCMTCFGAVGNMPCPMIYHDLLEYLFSQMIFDASINRKR